MNHDEPPKKELSEEEYWQALAEESRYNQEPIPFENPYEREKFESFKQDMGIDNEHEAYQLWAQSIRDETLEWMSKQTEQGRENSTSEPPQTKSDNDNKSQPAPAPTAPAPKYKQLKGETEAQARERYELMEAARIKREEDAENDGRDPHDKKDDWKR